MIRRKETDGERIAFKGRVIDSAYEVELARDIDRLLRRRMAEAWKEGWSAASWYNKHECDNPYRGRKKK